MKRTLLLLTFPALALATAAAFIGTVHPHLSAEALAKEDTHTHTMIAPPEPGRMGATSVDVMERTASLPPEVSTTSANPGELKKNIDAADRFGNAYPIDKLRASNPNVCGCDINSGIFDLTFQDVCDEREFGFDEEDFGTIRRNVVCRVFADLSILLNPSNNIPNNFVRIEIRSSERDGTDIESSNQIAVASPIILSSFVDGITSGQVMKTIQSGIDSYTGLENQGFSVNSFHGFIRFNFQDHSFFADDTDFTSLPTGSDAYDLYTTTLHEAFHLLGFYSLIDPTDPERDSKLANIGASRSYSKYDTYLRTIGGINNTSLGTPYYLQYPLPDEPYIVDVALAPAFIEPPLCSSDVEFSGNANSGQELYRPFPWNDSGISHINCDPQGADGCASGNGFLMNSCSGLEYAQRFPHPDEVDILCDLGYTLSETYGTESFSSAGSNIPSAQYTVCTINQCNAIGVVDFYTVTAGSEELFAGFTDNDFNTLGYVPNSVELASFSNHLGSVQDYFGLGFTFTANDNYLGWAVLRYLPICSDGSPGNWTYILIQVVPPDIGSVPCPNSGLCNLVCFGNFENIPQGYFSAFSNFNLLTTTVGTPDIWSSNSSFFQTGEEFCFVQNDIVFPHTDMPNNTFFGGFITAAYNSEGMQFRLFQPLEIGEEYELSFYINSGCSNTLNFHFSTELACPNIDNTVIFPVLFEDESFVECSSGYNYNLGQKISMPFTSTDSNGDNITEWERYTTTIQATGAYEYLLVYQDIGVSYIYVDDISLVRLPNPEIAITSESVSGSPCPGEETEIEYMI